MRPAAASDRGNDGHRRRRRDHSGRAAPRHLSDGRLHFLALDLLDAQGRPLDRVVTWLQTECQWQALLKTTARPS